jgi:23S rRNA pseudouridine2605 synthase
MTDNDKQHPHEPESDRPELDDPLNTGLEVDATTNEEAESAAAESDTFEQAADDFPASGLQISEVAEEDEEVPSKAPAVLERLQKILAKSGIASRRHAEELISSGRVQVNGQVVTELGSKADPARDHIRVDGKLLQGSERHRYFILNKPKGYVTTVSDPEGRPTIMEFFAKTRERLYPVGRLDYLSEGLLLVTNDGELANKLTRAASGVEKTYLVKVSGQPSEEDLDRLRTGVAIQKGKPGSGRVQTAPAEIRPFRPGKPRGQRGPSASADNPWYEVVLIEGRNRELRKMFEEIGHHVEKIRRIGYGPLVLDLEPGKTRELEPEEIENLRKAAEGKYRKPKPRERRNRDFAPRSDRRTSKPQWNERSRPGEGARESRGREDRRPSPGKQGFEQRTESSQRPERGQYRRQTGEGPRSQSRSGGRPNPRFGENRSQRPPVREDREKRPFAGPRENRGRFAEDRPRNREDKPQRFGSRPPRRDFDAPVRSEGTRPDSRRFEGRPPQRSGASRLVRNERPKNPSFGRSDQPRFDRARGENRTGRSLENRPPRGQREDQPRFDRPRDENRPGRSREDRSPRSQREDRPRFDRPRTEDRGGRNRENRPPRERADQPRFDRPRRDDRPQSTGSRPPRTDRRTDQRPSGPRRAAGSFKPGKRGAPGGKQGGVRSGGSRQPGSRPGGNRGNKRRP